MEVRLGIRQPEFTHEGQLVAILDSEMQIVDFANIDADAEVWANTEFVLAPLGVTSPYGVLVPALIIVGVTDG